MDIEETYEAGLDRGHREERGAMIEWHRDQIEQACRAKGQEEARGGKRAMHIEIQIHKNAIKHLEGIDE
jgi:hypothetical protein